MLRSVLARVAGCCALAVAVTTPAMAADPLVVAETRFSVAETIDRLAKDLESKGIKVVKHGSLNPVIVSATPPRIEEEAPAETAVVASAAAPAKAKKSEKQNKK